jgi:hypothetical protein
MRFKSNPVSTSSECSASVMPRFSLRAARRYTAQLPTQMAPPLRERAVWIER